jgi:cytochrome b
MSTNSRTRVWDLPVRAFHWCLVLGVGVSLYTGLEASEQSMRIHLVSGQVNLALVLFRLAWGFIGGPHTRFGAFLRGPEAALRNLQDVLGRVFRPYTGHTPAGGWMIALMLMVIGAEAATGLFAEDDVDIAGPLNHLVTTRVADALTEIHELLYPVTITLICVHVLAIVAYRFIGKQRLVGAMIHGYKRGIGAADAPLLAARGLAVAAIVGTIVYMAL